jgi:hypothetical protein
MPKSGARMPSSRGGVKGNDRAGRAAAVTLAVWMVRTTVVGLDDGVTVWGSKLAVAPDGKPLTENVMGLPNAPCGAMVKTNVALWPGRTV